MENEIAKIEVKKLQNRLESAITALKDDLMSIADGLVDKNDQGLWPEYREAFRAGKNDLRALESVRIVIDQI